MRGRHLAALLGLALSLLLGGCWDRLELEDQLFVVSVGMDPGQTARYRITMRAAVVAGQRSGVLGGREGESPTFELMTVEANSLTQGMYVLNSSVSRRISLRHVRSIVVGEELARLGLHHFWGELIRNPEFRATSGFTVARGTAEEVLRKSRWPGEFNPARVPEGILLVEKQLHMAPPTRVHHLVNYSAVVGVQPFASVIAVNEAVVGEEEPEVFAGSVVAGDQRRFVGNPVEIAGTAIFRNTKLVGYLTVDETQAFLALRGEMGKAYVTIPSPFSPEDRLLMRFQQENLPKYTATLTPDGPRVKVKLIFEGEMLTGDEDYRLEQVRRKVEEAARQYMEAELRSVVAKTKEWRSDPVGFGLLFRSKFATWKQWEQFAWMEKLDRLQVTVEADMRIRRHGLNLGSEKALTEE